MRRIARGVLASSLLLCAGPLVAVAVSAMRAPTAPAVKVLPIPATIRLPASIIVVAPAGGTAAPVAGSTGTTTLPSLPVTPAVAAAIVAGEAGVTAARPFSLGRSGAADRGRALQCLTTVIYYEAASEPDAGQRAVAQVVLNRVRHPAFPASVCGVVYQGSERAGCQFSFACDGAMVRLPARPAWARAARTAAAALAGYVYAPVGLATHYHTYAVTPAWNRGLVMTGAVGAHLFHRWKGYWGAAAAFRQFYAGGEPTPGPPPRVVALAAVPPMPVASAAEQQPALQEPITPAPPAAGAAGGEASPDSRILPRWRMSGQPIDQ